MSTVFGEEPIRIIKIGTEINGNEFCVDITKISHLLVAGTTGSGKTFFIKTIISQIVDKKCKIFIFDSKYGTEYSFLNTVPSLLCPVITNPVVANNYIIYLLEEAKSRIKNPSGDYPEIIAIFDDFAFMKDILIDELTSLLCLGRDAKIHCIFVTSIVSADIIPTNLKSNIPVKICFSTSSKLISRMVIDENGAETLNSPREFIFKGLGLLKRCKSEYHDEDSFREEISIITQNYGNLSSYVPIPNPVGHIFKEIEDDYIQCYNRAVRLIAEKDEVSISFLQRNLKIGFSKGERIINDFEKNGIVECASPIKPKKVIMDRNNINQYLL